jgi:hypothetical protein
VCEGTGEHEQKGKSDQMPAEIMGGRKSNPIRDAARHQLEVVEMTWVGKITNELDKMGKGNVWDEG